ncbi:MAG: 3-phosphoshikimate 1-carboxyvinyltransferase [Clostridiales Family XIII bacterium]|jgi:3-phosphoshikimate 1-carboxyvinyltransferase|nr:3-phosphoshikimate 1-carboxyvinyltransferase [Clostridiales Family XIII bacterium]
MTASSPFLPAELVIDRFPSGTVRVPPSKSLSHRAAICAALAGGEAAGAVVRGLGDSEDIRATVRGIARIVSRDDGQPVDCGESGSTLRFLIPLAAMAGGAWRFTGRGRLLERPLQVYADVFRAHGGEGSYFIQEDGEVRVRGPLLPGDYLLPGDVSSQFLTGLLLALPLAAGDSRLSLTSAAESADYVRLTVDVMRAFGVRANEERAAGQGAGADADAGTAASEMRADASTEAAGLETLACGDAVVAADGYRIPGGQAYAPAAYTVEGDWSQAAFFLCAAALGRDVRVEGLRPDSHQGDRRAAALVEAIRTGQGTVIDCRDIPDLVPPLAALACYARGVTRFVNAGRLRIKESDRLAALAQELSNLGAGVREEGDALVVAGVGDGQSPTGSGLPGGRADAHGDHRIAMAVAVAAIGCRNPVRLTGADSVAKSYPHFWEDFLKAR